MSGASTSSSMTWAERCSKAISGSRAAALALHGAVTDVATVVDPGPTHAAGERVGFTLRCGDARTQADRAQHTPPVGEHAAALEPRAGVKDLAGEPRGPLEAVDDVALAHALGIARGCHHDAERRARVPPGAHPVEALIERCLAERGEIGFEAHHDGLRLGISQPAVELEHVRGPVGSDHEP